VTEYIAANVSSLGKNGDKYKPFEGDAGKPKDQKQVLDALKEF